MEIADKEPARPVPCPICKSTWPRYEYAFRSIHIDPNDAQNRTVCEQLEVALGAQSRATKRRSDGDNQQGTDALP